MSERNVILSSSRDEIVAAYDFLMQLRLQNQLAAIQAGRPPQNIIHPGKLGYIQQELLKQAFAQIAAVQKENQLRFSWRDLMDFLVSHNLWLIYNVRGITSYE